MYIPKTFKKLTRIGLIAITCVLILFSYQCTTTFTQKDMDEKNEIIKGLEEENKKLKESRLSFGDEDKDTEPISHHRADSCIRSYDTLRNPLYTYKGNNASHKRILKGFMIVTDSIEPLLKHNDLEFLYLQLAVSPEDLFKADRDRRITFIVSGLDKDSVKLNNPQTGRPWLFEYLKPCPDNCAK